MVKMADLGLVQSRAEGETRRKWMREIREKQAINLGDEEVT